MRANRQQQDRRSPHAAWRDPLARAHQALDVASRRLRRSSSSIEAGERLFATRCVESDRHWHALRRLTRVSRWLNSAGHRLFAAQAALQRCASRAYYDAPDDHYERASTAIGPATLELLDLAVRITDLELRFQALGVSFRTERKPGGLLADLPPDDAVPPQLSPAVLRRLRGDEAKPATHQPYRQPVAFSATAFRRVTRGRAPPALQLPTL